MATVVRSFAIQGIDGYPVDIEIKMLEGQPSISIIGLGDQAVKEAAVIHIGVRPCVQVRVYSPVGGSPIK